MTRAFATIGLGLLGLTGVYAQPAAKPWVPETLTIASLTGQDTYDAYCASCHGRTGAGDGPVAAALKTPPSDLRRLAEKQGGVFPAADVLAYVTGSGRAIAAHGPGDMPVWGPVFRALDPSDTRVRIRIENVVKFLEAMQTSPDLRQR
jgi:mono/diheme cytochrome c family protein